MVKPQDVTTAIEFELGQLGKMRSALNVALGHIDDARPPWTSKQDLEDAEASVREVIVLVDALSDYLRGNYARLDIAPEQSAESARYAALTRREFLVNGALAGVMVHLTNKGLDQGLPAVAEAIFDAEQAGRVRPAFPGGTGDEPVVDPALPIGEIAAAIEDANSQEGLNGEQALAAIEPTLARCSSQIFELLRSGALNGLVAASSAALLSSLLGYALGYIPLEAFQIEFGKVGTPAVVLDDLAAVLSLVLKELDAESPGS